MPSGDHRDRRMRVERFITTLRSVCEKLYLNENWTLTPSDVKPSEKFSRRPHWNSPPIMTFGTGV